MKDDRQQTVEHFADHLVGRIVACGNPVVVGLDPRWDRLPPALCGDALRSDMAIQAAAYRQFCRGVIDVVAPMVPAVKVQAAFFEELGPAGMVALGEVIEYAQEQNLLVIFDGKRNDIGSTAEAYARGILGRGTSGWGADAVTVSPYLGEDSLQPFVDVAVERGAGLFVLVKTSNPGGPMLQDLVADGRTVYALLGEHVEHLAVNTCGEQGYGVVGAVVGATYPEQLAELRELMPHALLLVPGFGSQGGTARDVAAAFDERGLGAVVNNSRGIIFAYERPPYAERFGEAHWQEAVAAATGDMIDALRADTTAGRLGEGQTPPQAGADE